MGSLASTAGSLLPGWLGFISKHFSTLHGDTGADIEYFISIWCYIRILLFVRDMKHNNPITIRGAGTELLSTWNFGLQENGGTRTCFLNVSKLHNATERSQLPSHHLWWGGQWRLLHYWWRTDGSGLHRLERMGSMTVWSDWSGAADPPDQVGAGGDTVLQETARLHHRPKLPPGPRPGRGARDVTLDVLH